MSEKQQHQKKKPKIKTFDTQIKYVGELKTKINCSV